MRRSPVTIDGIVCVVQSPDVRRAIRTVLEQIKKRYPEDFARIRGRVRRIAPLAGVRAGRAQSAWHESARSRTRSRTDGSSPGVLKVAEDCTAAVAVIAHELGHVCTRQEDFERREASASGDSALAKELCADRYAYRWGFGRDVSKARRDGHMAHHGPPPSSEFALGPFPDGQLRRYRVTPDFVIEFVRAEPPPADDAPGTAAMPESGVKQLLIVSREQPHLYDYAVAEFSRVPGLRIIRDRRGGERAPKTRRPERPVGDRRRVDIDTVIQKSGSAIVAVPRKASDS
jgi:hypothetical protein